MFITLAILNILFLFIVGKKTANNKERSINISIIICALTSSLVYGLRVGWLDDWFIYEEIFSGNTDVNVTTSIKYSLIMINGLVKLFGGEFYLAVTFYTFIYFLGLYSVLKDKVKFSWFTFPIAFILSFELCAQHVSFCLAAGFLYWSFYFYKQCRFLKALLFLVLSAFSHIFIIVFIPFFIFYKKIDFTGFKIIPLLSIWILSTFVTSQSVSEYLMDLTSYVNAYVNFGLFEGYASGEKFFLESEETFSNIYYIKKLIAYSIVIYLFVKYRTSKSIDDFFFSIGYLAIILWNLSRGIQFLDRICYVLIVFSGLMIANSLFQYRLNTTDKILRGVSLIIFADLFIRNGILQYNDVVFNQYIFVK